MINIGINDRKLSRIVKQLEGTRGRLPKELAIAINATVNNARSGVKAEMRKAVQQEIKVSAKAVNKTLQSMAKATPTKLRSGAVLLKGDKKKNRIPLKEFSARQGRKGVAYAISKTGGRKLLAGAFQGPKPGKKKASWQGNVFKRAGKSRLPIIKQFGPSPWGVFVKHGKARTIQRLAERELQKQINRRIRYHVLKSQGAI